MNENQNSTYPGVGAINNNVPNVPPVASNGISNPKSRGLTLTIRFFLILIACAWLMYVLQILGFMVLGVGGFLVSSLIKFSLVQLWQPLSALVLLILGLVGWKKIPEPVWVLAASLGTLILMIIAVGFQSIAAILGLILVGVAVHKFNRNLVASIGPVGGFARALPYILVVILVLGSVVLGFGAAAVSTGNSIEAARERQRQAQQANEAARNNGGLYDVNTIRAN